MLAQSKTPLKSPSCRIERDSEETAAARAAASIEQAIAMFFSWFLILFIVFFVAWFLGWTAFHVAGGLIHILLVVAVISLIVHFARGRP